MVSFAGGVMLLVAYLDAGGGHELRVPQSVENKDVEVTILLPPRLIGRIQIV